MRSAAAGGGGRGAGGLDARAGAECAPPGEWALGFPPGAGPVFAGSFPSDPATPPYPRAGASAAEPGALRPGFAGGVQASRRLIAPGPSRCAAAATIR